MRKIISAVFFFLFISTCVASDKKDEKPKPAQSIDELRQQLDSEQFRITRVRRKDERP